VAISRRSLSTKSLGIVTPVAASTTLVAHSLMSWATIFRRFFGLAGIVEIIPCLSAQARVEFRFQAFMSKSKHRRIVATDINEWAALVVQAVTGERIPTDLVERELRLIAEERAQKLSRRAAK
jgi:hypothetical protein